MLQRRVDGLQKQELLDQPRGPIPRREHALEGELDPRRVAREIALRHLRARHDDDEQVVEVVRDPTGEEADRFHLLGLAQAILGPAQLPLGARPAERRGDGVGAELGQPHLHPVVVADRAHPVEGQAAEHPPARDGNVARRAELHRAE